MANRAQPNSDNHEQLDLLDLNQILKSFIHVVKDDSKYCFVYYKNLKDKKKYRNVQGAVHYAKSLQKQERVTILIHDKDGTVKKQIKPQIKVLKEHI